MKEISFTSTAVTEALNATQPSPVTSSFVPDETTPVQLPCAAYSAVDVTPVMSDAERQALEAAGVPEEEAYAAVEKASRLSKGQTSKREPRAEVAQRIQDNLPLFQSVTLKPLWAARDLGAVMVEKGLYRPVQGWNALGDTLGKHLMKLPFVTVGARRYYDIGFSGSDEIAKASRHEELNAMQVEVLKLLIAMPKTTEGAGSHSSIVSPEGHTSTHHTV